MQQSQSSISFPELSVCHILLISVIRLIFSIASIRRRVRGEIVRCFFIADEYLLEFAISTGASNSSFAQKLILTRMLQSREQERSLVNCLSDCQKAMVAENTGLVVR